MIRQPRQWLESAISLQPNLVILHAEAEGDLLESLKYLQKLNIKAGVALLPDTTPAAAAELIKIADHALIFGGHLGYQGGTADLAQLSKAAAIRALNPKIEIGWDGGATADNVQEIARAGVDVINVGSAILKSDDPEAAFAKLTQLLAT
jgi:ribulose-phosphate 3-epimerase